MLVMVTGTPVDVNNIMDSPYKIRKTVIGDNVKLLTTLLIDGVTAGPAQSWLVKVYVNIYIYMLFILIRFSLSFPLPLYSPILHN